MLGKTPVLPKPTLFARIGLVFDGTDKLITLVILLTWKPVDANVRLRSMASVVVCNAAAPILVVFSPTGSLSLSQINQTAA